ncbi:MAG: glycosyltransferase family 2 protein [Acidobacteria bacterium]|nr:glycosyltransferase family 2 protein [Acidobacteriota bacterium]
MSHLSVVIVNYRSGELLNGCLDALSCQIGARAFEILVINNDGAEDLSPLRLHDRPGTRIIQSPSNLGFGVAANIGFRQSKGEFLLLLNPDVLARPGSIESLLETMRSHPEAGIALPQLRNPDDSLQYSCRRFYTWHTLWKRRGPWRRLLAAHPTVRRHLMQDWDHASVAEVDWGLGAAMLVRKRAVPGPNLFDERFFLYFEDVDLCLRLRRSGWKVIYNPAAVMTHQHRRDSARPGALLAKRRHMASLMKFLWKYRFRVQ